MKILFLSDPSSVHTVKWVNSLSDKGLEVFLFGFGQANPAISDKVTQIIFEIETSRENIFKKLNYLTAIFFLKRKVQEIKPDIVHSHFATSYGLLGMLLKHDNFLVSIWGSDVFDFPKKSIFHKALIKRVLSSAKKIFSTSETMKIEGAKYTENEIFVTPFGVDLKKFKPLPKSNIVMGSTFKLGTIKALEDKYGIDILIKSFAQLIQKSSDDLSLQIVGKGSKLESLIELVKKLGIGEKVEFVGQISQDEVISYHNNFDIEIFPSVLDSESFGVSVVEAMACGTPVIVSDVSGFKEVVEEGECGLIVEKGNIDLLVKGIFHLMENKELMEKYISKGLERVAENYNWDANVDLMIGHYRNLLEN